MLIIAAIRGLDRALFVKFVAGDWIAKHDSLVITGPTRVGKSGLASALGHKACGHDRSVLYQRVPNLFASLALARGDGPHARPECTLGTVQRLNLDDCGLKPLNAPASLWPPGMGLSVTRSMPRPYSTAPVHNADRLSLAGERRRLGISEWKD